jgi:hypothetical protein
LNVAPTSWRNGVASRRGAELGDWLQAEKEIDAAERDKQSAPENQMTG